MTTPTLEYLNECFFLDRDTGNIIWKERPAHHFIRESAMARFNKIFSGKHAGNYRPDGYVRILINKTRYYAHRIVYSMSRQMEISDIPKEIDHIDKNQRNNKPENLRAASRSQNVMNTTIRADNTSGFKGVGFDRRIGKWVARVKLGGKVIYHGSFQNPESASLARNIAAEQIHGIFARAA